MASASSLLPEEHLLCSICLDVFTDPISTPCGHNYCKACITHYWETSDLCHCPVCNTIFCNRPELSGKVISEMVDQFRSSKRSDTNPEPAKPDEVSCDSCTEPIKLNALQSCLAGVSDLLHKLINPVKNPEDIMCQKHDRPLELFCKTDLMCVCQFCTEADHKSHQIVSLKEAYDGKKAELGKTEAEVQQMIRERQVKIHEVERSVVLSKKAADREIADSVKVFTALISCIARSQAEVRNVIEEKQKSTEKQSEGFIKELQQEITLLEKRSSELKQLSHAEDHIQLLQNFKPFNIPVPIKDWSKVSVHPSSYVGTVGTVLDQLKKTLSKEMEKQIRKQYHYQDNLPLFKDRNKTTVAHASHSDEQSAGTVPRVISAHTQGSVAAQSTVRVKVIVKGQTFNCHSTLLQRVRQLGGLHIDETDSGPNVVIVFCPVSSRPMTDIEAMTDVVPGGAAVILVVMHHTHVVDYSKIVCSLGSDRDWDFVNVLYHETVPGLQTCTFNEQAVAQLRDVLLKHSSVVSSVAVSRSVAAQSTVRVQVIVKGQTFNCHRTLLQRVRQLGGLHVDETASGPNVVIVFCPVKTRHMTDIEAAMKDVVPGGAAVILVVMHHTHNVDYLDIVRTLGGDRGWDFVNVLYHETVPGLLTCTFNEQAVAQLHGALLKHSSVVSPVAATAAAAASVYGSYGGGSSGKTKGGGGGGCYVN